MINQETVEYTHDPIAQIIFNYKSESYTAKRNRIIQNRENFEAYHLRQDYSHKKKGQSKEFIPKVQNAVEQITSFLQQGLMDQGRWFSSELEFGVKNPLVQPFEMEKLLLRQLSKNKFPFFLSDSLKVGLLGALMVVKVGGKKVTKCNYSAEDVSDPEDVLSVDKISYGYGKKKKKLFRVEKEVWQLELSLVRQEDYYPDPTGRGQYEIQQIEMDYHQLLKMAEDNPGEYDLEAVKRIPTSIDDLQRQKKSRETGQNVSYQASRRPVTILELWGNLIEPSTGELLHENVVCAIDTTGQVIKPPKKNPLWHNESPYVVSPIVRVPHSVWHRALMDAPAKLNIAMNELYNLSLDGGLMSVFGIKQLRPDWLQDPSQVSGGIAPAETLLLNSSAPPGAKVLERVDTGAMSKEALDMYNLTDREYQASAVTNDTRLGSTPQRAVKATEIVASNQAITGIFNGIVKVIEEEFVAKILEKSWLTMAQHMNDLDDDEVGAILGDDRAKLLSNIDNETVFAKTAVGRKYKVFGLSMTLNKIQDFRKITSLLQSIGSSPMMLNEFQRKYSMTKLMGEIVKSLDIEEQKILMDPQEAQQVQAEKQQQLQMQMMQAQGGQGGGDQGSPTQPTEGGRGQNPMSQIPQASASPMETGGIEIPRGQMNQGMTHP